MITGKAIFGDTVAAHYPPLKYNAVKTMLEGNLPLWNPHIFAGMPLLGDSSSGPFDILNAVFLPFNPLLATVLFTSLQLFFAGLFMYLYLDKSLRLNNYSCLLGGIVYMLNPALLYGAGARLDFLPSAGTIIWLPLIMLFIDKAVESELYFAPYALLSGFALSFSFFSGGINLMLFIAFFICLYISFSPLRIGRRGLILLIISASSLLITAAQLFPTLNAAGLSNRTLLWPRVSSDSTGLSLTSFFISIFDFPLGRFLNVFNIDYLGDIIRNYQSWYMGILNLLLVSLTYFRRNTDYKIRFYKLFIPAFLILHISMFYLPIRGFLTSILPILKGARIGHSMFLLYFAAIVLISRTFNDFFCQDRWSEASRRFMSWLVKIATPVISLLSLVIIFAGTSRDKYDYVCALLCLVMLAASFPVVYRVMKAGKKAPRVWARILFLLIISPMVLEWGVGYGRQRSYRILPAHFSESVETRFLKSMKPEERVEILYGGKTIFDLAFSRKQYFGFNLPLFYRAHTLGGSHPLHSGRARVFFDMINKRYPFDQDYYWKGNEYINPTGRAWLEDRGVNFNLVDLAGVRYIFSPAERKENFLKLKARGDSYFIYENLNAYPRGFIVYEYEVQAEKDILDKLNSLKFDPRRKVLLEEPVSFNSEYEIDRTSGGKTEVRILLYKPNEVIIGTESDRNGFLVFTDAYDRNWRAYIDNRGQKIYSADYLFRAVPLTKGAHRVMFRYMPTSFVYGAWVSIVTIIFSAIGVVVLFKFPSRAEDPVKTEHIQRRNRRPG
jgi:hypothetical protein